MVVPGVSADHGEEVPIDPATGACEVGGGGYVARPVPRFMLETVEAGGLVQWGRRRVAAQGGA